MLSCLLLFHQSRSLGTYYRPTSWRCLRRFTATRGCQSSSSHRMWRRLKLLQRSYAKVFSYPNVKRFLANKTIAWRFNVDRAPWWGDLFERLIQDTKRCLQKTWQKAKLNYNELHTVLVEVKGTLNFRPLAYVSSEDIEELLKLCHVICRRGLLSLPGVTPNRQASLDLT